MSFGKIIKGYGDVFSSLLSFLAIALACVIIGFVICYPLWFLATTNVTMYTIFSIVLFLCAFCFFLLKGIIKEYKKCPRRLFISLFKKIILIGGLVLFCFFVLNFYTMLAILTLIAVFILYGILAFGVSQDSKK